MEGVLVVDRRQRRSPSGAGTAAASTFVRLLAVLPCQKLAELRTVDERLAASVGDEATEICDLSERSRTSPPQGELRPIEDAGVEKGSEIQPGTCLVPCGGTTWARIDPPRLAPHCSMAA
mmetsp:Transcript_109193/g.216814  ORF Transcript_109193/g.216814 Transcript_109193/m.216814 type:complete len:120 (+) Transcript_109193:1086-1445(+)